MNNQINSNDELMSKMLQLPREKFYAIIEAARAAGMSQEAIAAWELGYEYANNDKLRQYVSDRVWEIVK